MTIRCSAPAGIQTARKAIDEGQIGRPVAFHGFMLGRGPERFHPNPAFFYQPGGGPMFDMGPYYLTALLNLLGRVKRLSAAASIAIHPMHATQIVLSFLRRPSTSHRHAATR